MLPLYQVCIIITYEDNLEHYADGTLNPEGKRNAVKIARACY